MYELIETDLRYVVQRLPKDVRDLLYEHRGKLLVGGGFIRAAIAGEEPSDIDFFGPDEEFLNSVATIIRARRPESRLHRSKNAVTVTNLSRMPLQFITRWTFSDATSLVASFDFTVCQAAVWMDGSGKWCSQIGDRFYIDLAARRLTYTSPVREEEAGGSMMRVLKYVKRGYTIQVTSLGNVIDRLVSGVHEDRIREGVPRGQIIGGLLREVDPLLVIDGFDVVDEHEEP